METKANDVLSLLMPIKQGRSVGPRNLGTANPVSTIRANRKRQVEMDKMSSPLDIELQYNFDLVPDN